jgi:hypothetical protein
MFLALEKGCSMGALKDAARFFSQRDPNDDDSYDQDAAPGRDDAGEAEEFNDNAAETVDKPTTDATGMASDTWGDYSEVGGNGQTETIRETAHKQSSGQSEKSNSPEEAKAGDTESFQEKEIKVHIEL